MALQQQLVALEATTIPSDKQYTAAHFKRAKDLASAVRNAASSYPKAYQKTGPLLFRRLLQIDEGVVAILYNSETVTVSFSKGC